MYTPTQNEFSALLEIISKLNQADSVRASRQDIADDLLELLQADHLASYIRNRDTATFEDCVALNIAPAHLERYDRYFQHHDPISPRIQLQRQATIVSDVIRQKDLEQTEFFNDFLIVAGMHHGLDMHLYDGDAHLGDLRIWRARHRPEFSCREVALLDILRPHLIGALRRLNDLAHERTATQRWQALWMQHPHASFVMKADGDEASRNLSADRLASQLSPEQRKALPALLRNAPLKLPDEDIWNEFIVTVSASEQSDPPAKDSVYLVQLAKKGSPAPAAADLSGMFGLTHREADVCALVLQGYTDKEIAKTLAISFPTVRTHLTHSFAKFGVTNRAELIHCVAKRAR